MAFYRRFQPGADSMRSTVLYIHLICNSIAFFLVHFQLMYPGGIKGNEWHPVLGKICFYSASIGTMCAFYMFSEHDSVPEYGGFATEVGFWLMSACMMVPAAVGVMKMKNGDKKGHREWMFRFAGGMWGAFWGTRLPVLVLDPILRNFPLGTNFCISMWISGPLGLIGGEIALNRANTALKMKGQ